MSEWRPIFFVWFIGWLELGGKLRENWVIKFVCVCVMVSKLPFTTLLAEAYATSVVINNNSNTTGIFMMYARHYVLFSLWYLFTLLGSVDGMNK